MEETDGESGGSRPRPRVLLVAYACSPDRGSECAVGWNSVLQVAQHADAWVICQDGPFGDEVRHYLQARGPIPGLTFEFVPKSRIVQFLMRFPGLYYVGYNLWHRAAYRAARRLHTEVRFDLAHLVNLCSYREPGYVWQLDLPFIWGPWGGTGNYPWRFLGEAGLAGGLIEAARSAFNICQLGLGRRLRRAAQRSAVLLANNAESQRSFSRAVGITPELLPSTGITHVAQPRLLQDRGGRLRVLWSGRLEPLKGLSLLLRALSHLPEDSPCEVRILGSGPAQQRWQRLAGQLGVQRRLTWLGWLPHRQALEQYSWADVLVFTSLRDTCPMVLLEALAAGLPIICLDHQGMADIVTSECGIKVPVTTPRDAASRIAQALQLLVHDPALWERLSQGAIARAEEYLWPRLGARMAAVYRRVLDTAGVARRGDMDRPSVTRRNNSEVGSTTGG